MGQQWERSLFCQFQLLGSHWEVHWLKLTPGLNRVLGGKTTPPNIFFRLILPNFEEIFEIVVGDFERWPMLPVRKTTKALLPPTCRGGHCILEFLRNWIRRNYSEKLSWKPPRWQRSLNETKAQSIAADRVSASQEHFEISSTLTLQFYHKQRTLTYFEANISSELRSMKALTRC